MRQLKEKKKSTCKQTEAAAGMRPVTQTEKSREIRWNTIKLEASTVRASLSIYIYIMYKYIYVYIYILYIYIYGYN